MRRRDWYLAVPVIAPALLLLAGNADFMFDDPGWIDTFGMLGRFWHYAEQNPLFEQYQGSRLPWILPGFVLHQIFDEVTASYILHTTVLIASGMAVYLLLRDTLGERASAAIVAVAWASCTWIHGNGGWNYHVVAAVTYYLWSLWMLARAARSARPGPWLTGSGAALACAIHAHAVFAAFVPIAALLYLPAVSAGWRQSLTRVAAAAGYAAAGGLGATAALALVNVAVGGRWLFFLPQLEYMLYVRSQGNRWVQEPAVWIPEARHLVIPGLVLVGALLWLAHAFVTRGSRRSRERAAADSGSDPRSMQFAWILAWQGVLASGLMTYFQFVTRQTALDLPYMAVPLYGHVFPMLGTLLWQARPRSRREPWLTLAAAAAILAPLLLWLPSRLFDDAAAFVRAVHLPDAPVIAAPLAVGLAGLLLASLFRGWPRIATFAVWYGLLNAWLAAAPNAYGIGTPGINRDIAIVLRSLDKYATTLDPSLFAVRFWSEPELVQGRNRHVQLADVFRAFMATRRRSLVTAAYDRPGIRVDDLTPQDLYSSSCLGVLSSVASHMDVVARAMRRFDEIGAPLRAVGRHDAHSGPISVALTVLTMRPQDDPRPGLLPCPPSP